MPKVHKNIDLLQRLAELEEQVSALARNGRVVGEVPFYPTSLRTFVYEDNTSFTTLWETIISPRAAQLSMGLVFIGDIVGTTNSGGEWRVQFDDSTTVASGNVPATFTYALPALSLDLTPYRAAPSLKIQIQVRRTSGATTGGKFGNGGAIGGAPRYARLI
ncbi:hypothetical protein [Streptomyces sp. ECR3.8]|uniref:hypothetical protein n=1 Tax=Streptomyces sp. ECR3.8 TaxID=3461009 RepID=UPI004042BFC8